MRILHIYLVKCLLFFSPMNNPSRAIFINFFHINTMTIHHITFRISSFNWLNHFLLPSSVWLKIWNIGSLFLVFDVSFTPTVLALLALPSWIWQSDIEMYLNGLANNFFFTAKNWCIQLWLLPFRPLLDLTELDDVLCPST